MYPGFCGSVGEHRRRSGLSVRRCEVDDAALAADHERSMNLRTLARSHSSW